MEKLEREGDLKHLVPELERFATVVARGFKNRLLVSPYLFLAHHKAAAGQLPRQEDDASCTRVSLIDALTVLDQPDPMYSLQGLETALKTDQASITAKVARRLFRIGEPYNKFCDLSPMFKGLSPLDKTVRLIDHLGAGGISTLGFPFEPELETGHQRTVVGYLINPDLDLISLGLIDPYDPTHVQMWPLQNVFAGLALDTRSQYQIRPYARITRSIALEQIQNIHNIMLKRRDALAA